PAVAGVASDVDREHGARRGGAGPHRPRLRHPAAVAPQAPRPLRAHGGRRIPMRILDRYLLREFLVYLLLGLMGFIVIFVVVDLIEKMDVFLDHKAPWFLVAQYFVNLAPDVVVKMLPVALLLATFLALGQLNKFGELTAMRAGGLSLLRILQPVFAVACACVAMSLVLGEYVVPAATRARDVIFEERIQHLQRTTPSERADVTYLGSGGRVWLVGLYLVHEQRMHDVSL